MLSKLPKRTKAATRRGTDDPTACCNPRAFAKSNSRTNTCTIPTAASCADHVAIGPGCGAAPERVQTVGTSQGKRRELRGATQKYTYLTDIHERETVEADLPRVHEDGFPWPIEYWQPPCEAPLQSPSVLQEHFLSPSAHGSDSKPRATQAKRDELQRNHSADNALRAGSQPERHLTTRALHVRTNNIQLESC